MGDQKLYIGSGGAIRGVWGKELSHRDALRLGGVLGRQGLVGLGGSRTPAAQMLVRAALTGVVCTGGRARVHPLDCPVQGAWAAAREALPVSLFVEETKKSLFLHLFDCQGLPLDRGRASAVEDGLERDGAPKVPGDRLGTMERLEVTEDQWARAVAARASLHRPALRRLTAAVEGDQPEDRALRLALSTMGCRVEREWRAGIPAFQATHGGLSLTARDEKGALLDDGQLLALVTLIEMENGSGTAALPPRASAAAELVAAGCGGTVLRLEQDGPEARDLYAAQPWMREGISAALRICARMGASGQKLGALMAKTPRFNRWSREVPLRCDRGTVLSALSGQGESRSEPDGLCLRTGGGWVHLTMPAGRSILRVMAEGPDMELAAELCDQYANRAGEADRALLEQKCRKWPLHP